SLPGLNGQAPYSGTGPYYPAVVNGQYELWNQARMYSAGASKTVAQALAGLLNLPASAAGGDGLGFLQPSQMKCYRATYTNHVGGFHEDATDGGFITFTARVLFAAGVLQ